MDWYRASRIISRFNLIEREKGRLVLSFAGGEGRVQGICCEYEEHPTRKRSGSLISEARIIESKHRWNYKELSQSSGGTLYDGGDLSFQFWYVIILSGKSTSFELMFRILKGNIKSLRKLNFTRGKLLQEVPQLGNTAPSLSITSLSLDGIDILHQLQPSQMPFVRSLRLTSMNLYPALRLLLPQITHVDLDNMASFRDSLFLPFLEEVGAVEELSIEDWVVASCSPASVVEIAKKVVSLRFRASNDSPSGYASSYLIRILKRSTVLKKLSIVSTEERISLRDRVEENAHHILESIEVSCKKKGVEVWKEGFIVDGKVDLD
jgi:hypothetical protein